MRYFIFANGELSNFQIKLPGERFIIAADGGASHCLKLGIIPQVVIGDIDSISDEAIATLETSGSKFVRYPADKDETDLELALNYAVEEGASEITTYGLLGGRWDMSLANILLLASPRFKKVNFQIIDGNSEMFILRGGNTIELNGMPGDMVSAIPLTPQTKGITYSGLRWHLENATLGFGSPRGVSNRMLEENAQISLDSGVLFVVIQRRVSRDNVPSKEC
jgi:thiamine pyrophosphokinase